MFISKAVSCSSSLSPYCPREPLYSLAVVKNVFLSIPPRSIFSWLPPGFNLSFSLCSLSVQFLFRYPPCKALFADLSEVCISLDKLLDNKQKSSLFPAFSPLCLTNIYFLGYPLGAVSSAQKQKQRGYVSPPFSRYFPLFVRTSFILRRDPVLLLPGSN